MTDFDYDGPDNGPDNGPPELVRPFVGAAPPRPARTALGRARVAEPVLYRLIGTEADIAAHLDLLSQVMDLTNVSSPIPNRHNSNVRVYAVGVRRYPYSGGPK